WIQPKGIVHLSPYATPVRLSPDRDQPVWIGEVVPLEDRISFYLSIERTGGSLTAIVRNPEFGWLTRGTWLVELTGGAVALSQGANRVPGNYDAAS
ncbi:hypothetical protein Q8G41_27180, partial [Klebsiella pneumoniae]|uniref:hypothetical protein n=1 Tax=Klebsiella pneumoniae TaxID=573 RepID=UPI00301327B3